MLKGYVVKFNNQYMYPIDKFGKRVFKSLGSDVLVISGFSKQLYLSIDEEVYDIEILEENKEHSEFIDMNEKERKVYRPPLSHTWKQASFMKYLNKLKNEKQVH